MSNIPKMGHLPIPVQESMGYGGQWWSSGIQWFSIEKHANFKWVMWYFLCWWFQVCLNTSVPWCQNGGWWDAHRTIYNAMGNFPASYVWVQSLPFDLEVRARFWGMMLLFWEKSIETNCCFISHHSLNLIPIILHLRLLVGGLEHDFYFSHHIGNVIIPTDELHHFSEG